jgi:RimJ/RimL family protein N-acetyltransferase
MIDQPVETPKTRLRDGRAVTIRPLDENDYTALLAFGAALPQDDLLYLENDFQNSDIIRRLVNAAAAENWRQVVAVADGAIIGYSAVRRLSGWSSHVADIHLTVGKGWRRSGLGTAMAQAIFERLGFRVEGMLSQHARDRHGRQHNLIILAYHVS